MPPALILIVQLFMGALMGGWGLILATSITVISIVNRILKKNENEKAEKKKN